MKSDRYTFTAEYLRTASQNGFDDGRRRVEICDVRNEHGELVGGALWMTLTPGLSSFQFKRGQRFEFRARAKTVSKGDQYWFEFISPTSLRHLNADVVT